MNNPLHFYKEQLVELEKSFTDLKKLSVQISVVRFIIFLGTVFLVYSFFNNTTLLLVSLFIGISIFIFLIVKHVDLKRRKNVVASKIRINTTEINVLKGNFKDLASGVEFKNPRHFYSNDIDLFGKGSFYQFINRTATKDGKILLAKLLLENNTEDILEKQKAIKDLSNKVLWRQNFTAIANLVTVKNTSKITVNWMQEYRLKFSKNIAYLPKIFGFISILLIVLLLSKIISFFIVTTWFLLGLFITGKFFKKTQKLYNETNKVRETFKQYYLLLNEIETTTFTSKKLKEQQKIIQSEQKKASTIFKQFSKTLDAFDQRNNIIIAVFGNGLFLSDLYNATKTESWINSYKHTVQNWFKVVAFFDAYNSFANLAYNKPKFVFPEINAKKNTTKAISLGHPLLDDTKRIDNDLFINQKQFFIITGANMAGKSTFLRTVSLSIVMANCGLPVCAERFEYSPIKLITSMRTSDSLSDDESYFYSELKRLKYIVDEIKKEKYFIILDEILKGTNSKDKAIGSKQFIEKLTKSKSTGIIATHDISLCELGKEYNTIKNYFFDAEIKNNELYFDYKLKDGVCKNMNASFLLKKMEIVD